jgi:cytoskeletal protein RodZ
VATVGAILQTRREELKLTLEDVSSKTKVGIKFLAAIENEEFDLLPALSYSIGFVRLYATAVGLDAGAIAAQFKREGRARTGTTSADEHLLDKNIVRRTFPVWLLGAIIAFLFFTAIASYGCLRATPRAKPPVRSNTNVESNATGTAK